jgi:predicted permease
MVTANYFSVTGARFVEGRGFLDQEDEVVSGQSVVVLSHELARQVAADAGSAVGMDVVVNGTRVLVVGVTEPGFRGVDLPGHAELWLPLSARSVIDPATAQRTLSSRGEGVWRRMVGRMPPSTTLPQVAAAADATVDAVRLEYQAHSYAATHQRLEVFPGVGLDPSVRDEVRRTLAQLGAAALILLLLAIANVANLTLIESTRRETSTAVRIALGADGTVIVRSALVEAGLLGLASAVAAIGLAVLWGGWYQGAQLSAHGGSLGGMGIDVRVIGFALVTAWLASTLVSLRPALAARRTAMGGFIRRGATDGRTGHRLRSALVAAQVALSLVLLVSAGLLGRTVRNLRSVDLGFEPGRLLTFAIDPHLHGYESARLARLAQEVEDALERAGGVEAAGFISPSPLRGSYLTAALYGSDDPEARPIIAAGFYATPGLLRAMGARMIAGEDPWRGDSGTVVVSRGALTALYPGVPVEAAIGRLVPTRRNRGGLVRIAGIFEDLHLSDITREPPPVIIRPLGERLEGLSLTGVAAGSRPAALAPTVHAVLAARAPDLPVFDIRTARALIDLQFAERDAMATAAMTLSSLGLLLSAVGLYGVLAAMVSSRRREIGVRSALGAGPRQILWRVLATGLVPVMAGVGAGAVAAVGAGRVLASHLFGLAPLDPVSFSGAAAVLISVALAAALVPAWRATRVSPVEVLRED